MAGGGLTVRDKLRWLDALQAINGWRWAMHHHGSIAESGSYSVKGRGGNGMGMRLWEWHGNEATVCICTIGRKRVGVDRLPTRPSAVM